MNTHLQQAHINSYSRPLLAGNKHRWFFYNDLITFLRDAKAGNLRHIGWILIGALSLSIPVTGYVLAKISETASANLAQTRVISLFVSTSPASQSVAVTAQTLRLNQQILSVAVVAESVSQTPGDTTEVALLEIIPELDVKRPAITRLMEQLGALPGIEHVEFNDDLHTRNEKLHHYARFATGALYALTVLLAMLVTGKVIRRDVYSATRLITLKQQLGATSAQIRNPYLYRAVLLGLIVGGIGLLLVYGLSSIATYLDDLSPLVYNFSPEIEQILLFICIVISTSVVVTERSIRKIISI